MGQHIEREARWAQTGMTPVQRDRLVLEWHQRGVPFSKIGQHLGMSKSAVKYIYDRVSGGPTRIQKQSAMCEGCWSSFSRNELDRDGMCPECSDAASTKPPPPGRSEQW